MKKSVILSLFSLIFLTSCGSSYTFETPSIEHGGLFNYVHDKNMILDGKNDEEVYKNLEKFEIYEAILYYFSNLAISECQIKLDTLYHSFKSI